MHLDKFISKSRIIDIKSSVLDGAIRELLAVCPIPEDSKYKKGKLLRMLVDREKTMTTYLGNGVSLPHLRIPMKRPYIVAIGRCPEGLEYEGMEEYRELRLIFLLLASDKEKSYLRALSSLASTFHNKELVGKLLDIKGIDDFREEFKKTFRAVSTLPSKKSNKFNQLILKEASKIASGAPCSTAMVFADVFTSGVELGNTLDKFKTILVTQSSPEIVPQGSKISSVVKVRSFSKNRLSQMRSAILISLSRGLLKYDDKVCCIGGLPNSDQFDTVIVVDVGREFKTMLNGHLDMLPSSVKPEVLERVLAIATELAIEGREGKAIGALFVIGDTEQLKPFSKPLVLNPFFGYKDEDRNILNPFMDETVKEYSSIDGAFVIRGNGVLESAGSLIYAPDYESDLPSGLGSRHAAAIAISKATDCLSITVSASTRQVTVFRRGEMLPLM